MLRILIKNLYNAAKHRIVGGGTECGSIIEGLHCTRNIVGDTVLRKKH